ncbi:pyridoxamine 5'-phosphate oxidase family protein [Nocardioidaceae bacterium]|nr:pyridoxamine 5'-phosphate oxidase family protein [Nocardioidaceae bacterium]
MTRQHQFVRHGGWPEELTETTCRQLLASGSVGRLIWRGAEGLSAQPVNYVMDQGDITVRLSPYSLAGRECGSAPVAFEVDHVDPELRLGWSVLARGRGRREHLSVPSRQVDVWPAGVRLMLLRIEIDRLTGRNLNAPATAGTRTQWP